MTERSTQLTGLEERLDRFVRHNAVEQYNADVAAYNAWLAESQGRLDRNWEELERESKAVEGQRSEIDRLGEGFEHERANTDGSNANEIERLRNEHVAAVNDHNERVQAIKERQATYNDLVESGYHPFRSEISLREAGTPEIHRSIEAALAQARHIVVVASEPGRVQSQWVEAEWRLFLHLKLSGKKDGNLVNVTCEDMTAEALPPMLGMHQAIATNDPDWKNAC